MFDITAPLERQRTRDGRKVLAILDSKLNVEYPIAAWFSDRSSSSQLTKNGCYSNTESESPLDIITLPEQKPLLNYYVNIFNNNVVHSQLEYSNGLQKSGYLVAVLKITFDPNNKTSSSETVWVKEDKNV